MEWFKKLVRKNEQVYTLFRYLKRMVLFGPGRATAFRKAEKARKEKNRKEIRRITEEETKRQQETVFGRKVKFSILVPLYNTAEQYLTEMLESVLLQTYPDWELCLVDGSDKQHTYVGEACCRYADRDVRIRYQKLEKNGGISENSNVCIAMATGDYFGLLDHDDLLHPYALFEYMKAICTGNAVWIQMTSDSPPGQSITAWCSEQDLYSGNLTVNGRIQNGDLTCRLIMEEPVQSLMKRLICFTGLWMLVGGLWYFAAIRSDRISRSRAASGGACRLSAAERVWLGLCAATYLCFAILFRNLYRYGPDESARFLVAEFIYRNGTLPTGREELLRSSQWGFSYGFSFSLPYLISAFFMKLMSCFTEAPGMMVVASRLTSVFCMTGVGYYAIRLAKRAYPGPLRWSFIIPMTLTPQIVFLGSYLNLEAFTLFSVMMILDAWADGLAASWNPKSCIKLAIGISLCLLGYEFGWAFIPASALLYVWSGFWQGRRTDRKDVLRKGIFILLLVLIFCGWKFIRNGILYQGDFLGLQTREWYREQYGIPELQKAVRAPRWSEGISMFEMLWKTDWVMTTFKSMFCVLGYMSFWAARWVYRGYLMIIPVAAVGLVSAIRNEKQRSAAVCGFLACVLTVLFSVYYSWSNDYEPQGRYVIYTLPVLLLCSLKGLRVLETKFLGHMGKEYPDRKIRFECILSAAVLVFVVGSLGEAFFLLWKP